MSRIDFKHVVLKKGRDRSVIRRHPWIYSGAIDKAPQIRQIGETVAVVSNEGTFLAWAAYNPESQIACRIWSWDESLRISPEFFYQQLKLSYESRKNYILRNQDLDINAYRLVHAESDGIPGLIVDQYAEVIVAQFLSAGADYWRLSILQSLMEITGTKQVYERSDVDIRQLEGLPFRTGMLQGEFDSDKIMINENGIKFRVDIKSGQKTGFFLDQRANRMFVRKFVKDCDVLDCFCYTGGFTAASLAGGAASIVCMDSSANALAQLRENIQINDLDASKVTLLEGDVFRLLREFRDRGKSFDFIILDPPKFAQSVSQVERAARGYKDINLLALKLLRENGLLATFSCSGSVDDALFQKIVAGAALDAGVKAQIILRLHQDFDHPVALNFPEGAYLKGLLIKVE